MKIDDKVLTKALINSNKLFMDELPTNMEVHNFSHRFERNIRHLTNAEKRYGGKLWLEKMVSYSAKVAVLIVCLFAVNFVTIKAFNVNMWDVVITKTEEFLNLNFSKKETTVVSKSIAQYKIKSIPKGYVLNQEYESDNLFVQNFKSENGTITYTESLLNETANVNIENGESVTKQVGNWQVNCITGEDSITAFFLSDKYYHIIEIQGVNTTEEFLVNIIEELEER